MICPHCHEETTPADLTSPDALLQHLDRRAYNKRLELKRWERGESGEGPAPGRLKRDVAKWEAWALWVRKTLNL